MACSETPAKLLSLPNHVPLPSPTRELTGAPEGGRLGLRSPRAMLGSGTGLGMTVGRQLPSH